MSTTMGMGIGTNTSNPDEGLLRGTQIPVACSVWFTSTGRIIPKLIKYQDSQQQLHTLTNFQIIHHAEKYYCGISMIEYQCQWIQDAQVTPFALLFYVEQKEWKLWWKHRSP